MSFEAELARALGGGWPVSIPPGVLERLAALDDLLTHWSRRLDLIGFRSRDERIRRYFAEPVAAASFLPSEGRAVDVGSGGGSPGLVFAILERRLQWTLLEPRRKKWLFLDEAIRELRIENVAAAPRRFEEVGEPGLRAISTRGVRLARANLEAIGRTLVPGGRFLWLSSEAVLTQGALVLSRLPGLETGAPRPLLPGTGAFLLVVEKRPTSPGGVSRETPA